MVFLRTTVIKRYAEDIVINFFYVAFCLAI